MSRGTSEPIKNYEQGWADTVDKRNERGAKRFQKEMNFHRIIRYTLIGIGLCILGAIIVLTY